MPRVYCKSHEFSGAPSSTVHLCVLEFSDRILLSVSDTGKLGCFLAFGPALTSATASDTLGGDDDGGGGDAAEAPPPPVDTAVLMGAPRSAATQLAARLLRDNLAAAAAAAIAPASSSGYDGDDAAAGGKPVVVSICLADESRSRVRQLCDLMADYRSWPECAAN